MSSPSKRKRKAAMTGDTASKRVKKECSYGGKCFRKNPAHFREFSHRHLENILDANTNGDHEIPTEYTVQKQTILEQLKIIVHKKLYEPKRSTSASTSSSQTVSEPVASGSSRTVSEPVASGSSRTVNEPVASSRSRTVGEPVASGSSRTVNEPVASSRSRTVNEPVASSRSRTVSEPVASGSSRTVSELSGTDLTKRVRDPDNVPIVPPPFSSLKDYLSVVAPVGKMAAKHAASAPYHIFYTTIAAATETHDQPFSITFPEILDCSLGELKCSLQINFMVDPSWLLAQYYFAGYSKKKLTILYGQESLAMDIKKKKGDVDAHFVTRKIPFVKHHTKMMILCYEDGSLRVVVSTANLYKDDWENRTQGLWFSPSCPELPPDAMPHNGESPTMFKRCLLRYLKHYNLEKLAYYVERVRRCDFSHINVFLVASVPGPHFSQDWGMTRVGSLLSQHCVVPASEIREWPLIAQTSSLGSYGPQPKTWLTGDFLHQFTRLKHHQEKLTPSPELKLIYPSLENVLQSHDGISDGYCLPYAASINTKQPWLIDFLYQWKASHTSRDKAMPHIKSYTRISPDGKKAAYYLLTSANCSKEAWGQINKTTWALRMMSYETGVLFLPSFVINKDHFPLDELDPDRLPIPYDLPPTGYTTEMSPWVFDYLH